MGGGAFAILQGLTLLSPERQKQIDQATRGLLPKVRILLAWIAALLGISVRTLQEWEQGRRSPTGAAKTLLRVAETHPEILRELAAG